MPTSTPPQAGDRRRSPSRLLAELASFLLPLAAYAATLAPTVTLEDSGSFIAVARCLGVAHPPGFPLWCLLAHAFTWLPVGDVAVRVHLSSAVFAAAACWLVFRVALRRTGSPLAALAAALTLGFSTTLWSQAVIAEVYALNALFAALLILLALGWRDDGAPPWLLALGLASGLALANHTMIVLVVAPVWVWCLAGWRRRPVPGTTLLAAVGLGVLGLAVYLYLPLRARADPAVNWHDPETLGAVIDHIRRAAYFTPAEQARYLGQVRAVLGHTLDSWWQSLNAITWPLAAVAVAGLVATWRRDRGFALTTLAVVLLHTLVFNAYVHAADTPFWRFVHRVYYIPVQLVLALWVAPGLVWLAGRTEGLRWPERTTRRAALAVVVGGWLAVTGLRHAATAGLHGVDLGRRFGLDVVTGLPRQAGILPMGDMVVFTSLYLKEVEGVRPDLRILSRSFGWRGEPVSTLFAINPLTPAVVQSFPWCADLRSVPYGLGYLYVPAAQADSVAFRLLEAPPAPDELRPRGYDPFHEAIRTTYGGYYARAGAWALARGDSARALAWLDHAEALGADDPYVLYATAQAYHDGGVRGERVRRLLERALEQYDLVDAAADRYYPITPADIERLRDELP